MANPQLVDYDASYVYYAAAQCSHQELGPVISKCFEKIIGDNPDASLADAPRVYYTSWADATCEIEVAMPVDAGSPPLGTTLAKDVPGGTAWMDTHNGPYEGLADAWMTLRNSLADEGLQASGHPWDSYVVDSSSEPDSSKWVTEIYIPVSIQKIT